MLKRQKRFILLSICFAAMFAVSPAINAMHIMEAYLSPAYCIAWGVVSLPFLVIDRKSVV